MNLDLNNKVAVVTGASRGIGREVSLALSEEGMDVALVARGSSELEQLAARLRASGRKALPLAYDLRDRRAAETIIEAAVREFGKSICW
jgi:7-alpha-hydroxysteroid dehydrogenase